MRPRLVEINLWFSPRICSRTLMGVGAPCQCSLGAAPCHLSGYADVRALLMTSSHSEGYVLPDYNDDVEIEVLCQSGDGSTPAEAGALAIANPECKPVDCGVPPDVPRRELSTYAAGQTSFGTVVEFDCATGWIGSGGRMVCDFDGAWMVTRERCTATTTTTTQCKSPASPPASPPFSPLVLSFALSKLPV